MVLRGRAGFVTIAALLIACAAARAEDELGPERWELALDRWETARAPRGGAGRRADRRAARGDRALGRGASGRERTAVGRPRAARQRSMRGRLRRIGSLAAPHRARRAREGAGRDRHAPVARGAPARAPR